MVAGLSQPSGTASFILLLDHCLLKHQILVSFTSGNIQDFAIFSHPVSQKKLHDEQTISCPPLLFLL